jgi:hypothetical protein
MTFHYEQIWLHAKRLCSHHASHLSNHRVGLFHFWMRHIRVAAMTSHTDSAVHPVTRARRSRRRAVSRASCRPTTCLRSWSGDDAAPTRMASTSRVKWRMPKPCPIRMRPSTWCAPRAESCSRPSTSRLPANCYECADRGAESASPVGHRRASWDIFSGWLPATCADAGRESARSNLSVELSVVWRAATVRLYG